MSDAKAIMRIQIILAVLRLAGVIWNYDSYSRHNSYTWNIFNIWNTFNIRHIFAEAILNFFLEHFRFYYSNPDLLFWSIELMTFSLSICSAYKYH